MLSVEDKIERLRDFDSVKIDCCFKPHGSMVMITMGYEGTESNGINFLGDSLALVLDNALDYYKKAKECSV